MVYNKFMIDVKGIYYKELNEMIENVLNEGYKEIDLVNVNGQCYIGDGLIFLDRKFNIYGIFGNDMVVFMNGFIIEVFVNGQDGIGNIMNVGKIIVYGFVGDIIGYGMCGGEIFIKGDVGYRVGIYMKEY